MTVSRPIQLFALAGLLLVVAAGGMLMLHKSPAATPAATVAAPAAAAQTHARTATVAATKPATAAAKPAAATPKATPKPAPRLVAADGLPMPLAKLLHKHRIVVVSLFDPQARTEALSFAEARAGAAEAHVAFLGVSVLDDAVAGPLTSALPGGGLLPSPGVLVYRAPGSLVVRLDGFADRDAVAQAALAGYTAPATGATP